MNVILMTVLLLAATFLNFQLSPREQAVQIVGFGVKPAPVVVRVNTVGRYATVLTRGGMMEGSAVHAPILFEHFSFGWQALDLLDESCELGVRGLTYRDQAALMLGMPDSMENEFPCAVSPDWGTSADIEAVRKLMRGPLVPFVAVAGDWAMGNWYGAGGGQDLFARRYGEWRFIAGGGGAMGVDEMREYHVPESAWCLFGISGATNCPSKL